MSPDLPGALPLNEPQSLSALSFALPGSLFPIPCTSFSASQIAQFCAKNLSFEVEAFGRGLVPDLCSLFPVP